MQNADAQAQVWVDLLVTPLYMAIGSGAAGAASAAPLFPQAFELWTLNNFNGEWLIADNTWKWWKSTPAFKARIWLFGDDWSGARFCGSSLTDGRMRTKTFFLCVVAYWIISCNPLVAWSKHLEQPARDAGYQCHECKFVQCCPTYQDDQRCLGSVWTISCSCTSIKADWWPRLTLKMLSMISLLVIIT